MKKNILLLLSFLCFKTIWAQQIQIVNLEKQDVSFRALSALDEYIFWVSGSKGSVGFSVNAGQTIHWVNPEGYEERDFRAIEVLNPTTAIVAAVGSPGVILKTTDSGRTWKEVYRDESPDVFINSIQFTAYNPNKGLAIGDPINSIPYILETTDGGNTWKRVENLNFKFEEDEFFFAASNSNINLIDEEIFLLATGGKESRILLISDKIVTKKIPKTASLTAGINALDFSYFNNFGLVVGGDFENPALSENNMFLFELNKMESIAIKSPTVPPTGYKSGVTIFRQNKAVSCGLTGVDYSEDKGDTWKKVTSTPFHACKKSKKGNKVYLAGPEGRIGFFLE